MNKGYRLHPWRLTLRARLTLWYLLTLAAILLLFLSFLYWQVQRSLIAQVDAALQLAAAQALVNVNTDGPRLVFQSRESVPALSHRPNDSFAIYLLSPDGILWDQLGRPDEFSAQRPQLGTITVSHGNDHWRVYSDQIMLTAGGTGGWLQVAQEIDLVTETLASLRTQMLLGLPLALLLAGFGGFFLAWRALRPIDRITHTARSINANGLSRRINYVGPADEVGRLATTFDSMLNRLQDAFERERRFTGDAAHELRTPLTALKGRIEVTLSQPRSVNDYKATLEEMENQVDRLIRLSSDLLFMARLDQKRPQQQYERVDLDNFIGVVVDQVRPLAAAKSIELIESVPPGLVVRGDLDLLIRLFLNLLDNAVKYTPANGRVTILAGQDRQHIHISIQDSGPGIAAEHLPHLFERFYRAETHRSRHSQDNRYGGAGLGLAIAYEIARAHGGHLVVQSEVGQGTTFVVQLPLNQELSLTTMFEGQLVRK